MKQTPEEKANRELMMQLTGWAGIQISTPVLQPFFFNHFAATNVTGFSETLSLAKNSLSLARKSLSLVKNSLSLTEKSFDLSLGKSH